MITNSPVLDLSGPWQFRPLSGAPARLPGSWRPAAVPGNVHTDLMALGDLSDPHLYENEADVAWVESTSWEYRRRFELTPGLAACGRIHLQAEGLDNWAELRLNGRLVGRSANALVGHEWEISGLLRPGANELIVRFAAPLDELNRLQRIHGYSSPATSDDRRTWARKPAYSFGWDWGPRLVTSGIHKPMLLVGAAGPRITDLWVRVKSAGSAAASGLIDVEIDADAAGPERLVLRLGLWSAERALRLKKGRQRVRVPFRLPKPALWWPSGYGEPSLYQAEAVLASGAMAAQTVGLRTVELSRQKDRAGEAFGLRVNGVPVFCRGANWIPADSFLGRVTRERVEALVGKAKAAGMTMLRVWGGGQYETEDFYRACDRQGLLVWQDFPFACAEAPEEPWFLREVEKEARQAARRLRRHPSLASWCGNNENHQAVHDNWFKERHRRAWGAKIYHELLPKVMRAEDPERPYWPGSPFGGADHNSQAEGDRHNWQVWANFQPIDDYKADTGRFLSEFGFCALPNRRTLERAVAPQERWLQSRTLRVHDKVERGGAYARIAYYLFGQLPLSFEFDDFRYLSQVLQASALATAVEHWRRSKPHTQGAIFWQLNDCWPVASWSVLDGSDSPKLGYHQMARSMDPVLLSAVEADQRLSSEFTGRTPMRAQDEDGTAQCWLTLDGREPLSGTLSVELWGPQGRRRTLARRAVKLPSNASKLLWSARRSSLRLKDPLSEYLVFHLDAGGRQRRAILHFERPRRLALREPGVRLKPRRSGPAWTLEVRARRLALAVELHAPMPGDFEDNGFDLLPGEKRVVRFTPTGKPEKGKRWEAKTLNAIRLRQ